MSESQTEVDLSEVPSPVIRALEWAMASRRLLLSSRLWLVAGVTATATVTVLLRLWVSWGAGAPTGPGVQAQRGLLLSAAGAVVGLLTVWLMTASWHAAHGACSAGSTSSVHGTDGSGSVCGSSSDDLRGGGARTEGAAAAERHLGEPGQPGVLTHAQLERRGMGGLARIVVGDIVLTAMSLPLILGAGWSGGNWPGGWWPAAVAGACVGLWGMAALVGEELLRGRATGLRYALRAGLLLSVLAVGVIDPWGDNRWWLVVLLFVLVDVGAWWSLRRG